MATSTSSCFLTGTVVGCANNRRCGSPPPHQKQVDTLSRILAAFSGAVSGLYMLVNRQHNAHRQPQDPPTPCTGAAIAWTEAWPTRPARHRPLIGKSKQAKGRARVTRQCSNRARALHNACDGRPAQRRCCAVTRARSTIGLLCQCERQIVATASPAAVQWPNGSAKAVNWRLLSGAKVCGFCRRIELARASNEQAARSSLQRATTHQHHRAARLPTALPSARGGRMARAQVRAFGRSAAS